MDPYRSSELEPIDPARYLQILRRWWWLLAIGPLLLGAIVYLVAPRPTSYYLATATLVVNPTSSSGTVTSNDITAATRLAQSYASLVTSVPVLELVEADLGEDFSVDYLSANLYAWSSLDSNLINVQGRGSDPDRIVQAVNETARQYIVWSAEREVSAAGLNPETLQGALDNINDELDVIKAQLAALQTRPQPLTDAEREQQTVLGDLQDSYETARASIINLQGTYLEIAAAASQRVSFDVPAVVQTQTEGAPVFFYIIPALMLGFGAAGVGAVLLERLQDRVRTVGDISLDTGLPVLATIPRKERRDRSGSVMIPDPSATNALAQLRVRLQFSVNGRGRGTIAIARAEDTGGEHHVAANVAFSLAQANQRVLLIGANFQHHTRYVGAATELPFTFSELLMLPLPEPGEILSFDNGRGMWTVPVGPQMDHLSQYLTHQQVDRVLGHLRNLFDVIVIDSPPLTQWQGTLLFRSTDYGIIVVEADRTHRTVLRQTFEDVQATGANVLGVVYSAEGGG